MPATSKPFRPVRRLLLPAIIITAITNPLVYVVETYLHTDYLPNSLLKGAIAGVGCVLILYLLSRYLVVTHRHRYRVRHGLCPTCSYDLRAHKPGDKCPECGTSIAVSSPPQPRVQ